MEAYPNSHDTKQPPIKFAAVFLSGVVFVAIVNELAKYLGYDNPLGGEPVHGGLLAIPVFGLTAGYSFSAWFAGLKPDAYGYSKIMMRMGLITVIGMHFKIFGLMNTYPPLAYAVWGIFCGPVVWDTLRSGFNLRNNRALGKLMDALTAKDFGAAAEAMLAVGPKGPITAEQYETLPLFKEFRETPDFEAAFLQLYGRSPATGTASDSQTTPT